MDNHTLKILEESRKDNPVLDEYMSEVQIGIEKRLKSVLIESREFLPTKDMKKIIEESWDDSSQRRYYWIRRYRMEFEVDTGRTPIQHKPQEVQEFEGFTVTRTRYSRSKYNTHEILSILVHGWGFNKERYPPHMVEDTTTHHGLKRILPSVRCISDTFVISPATAARILDELRSLLEMHRVDVHKRAERGDWLTKLYVKYCAENHVKGQFYLWQRRYLRE